MTGVRVVTNIPEIHKRLAAIPGKLERTANRTLGDVVKEITRIMQRPGLNVRYPVKWDSPRQKRFVIAKLKRENNLPYRRTGQYAGGWKYEAIQNGYIVSNVGHKARYLAGDVSREGQSRIHQGRWRLFMPVVDAVLARLPEKLLEKLRLDVP